MQSQNKKRWFSQCPQCQDGNIFCKYTVVGDRLQSSTDVWGIYQCWQCQWVFLNPQPIGDLSWLYPDAYLSDTSNSQGLAAWYRKDQYVFDFEIWQKATRKSLLEMNSYVDIGAGSGERLAFLRFQGVQHVQGIDKYDQNPQVAQEFLLNTSVEEFYPQKKFAVAGMFHVLEHVPDPRKMIRHIRNNILQKKGELIIQVPNYASIERKLFGARWYGLDVPRHLWHFTPQTLTHLLESEGFTVLSVQQKNAWLHPVTTIASLFSSFDVQRLWVEKQNLSQLAYCWCFAGWVLGTLLTIPWSILLSVFNQGSMLTIVAQKE